MMLYIYNMMKIIALVFLFNCAKGMINGNDDDDSHDNSVDSRHDASVDSHDNSVESSCFYDIKNIDYYNCNDRKCVFSGNQKAAEILTDFLCNGKTYALYKFVIKDAFQTYSWSVNHKCNAFDYGELDNKRIVLHFVASAADYISMKSFGTYLNEFLSLYLQNKISFEVFADFINYFHDVNILDEQIQYFLDKIKINIARENLKISDNSNVSELSSSRLLLEDFNEIYKESNFEFQEQNDLELLERMIRNYFYIKKVLTFFKPSEWKKFSFCKNDYKFQFKSEPKTTMEVIFKMLKSRISRNLFSPVGLKQELVVTKFFSPNLKLRQTSFYNNNFVFVWNESRIVFNAEEASKLNYVLICQQDLDPTKSHYSYAFKLHISSVKKSSKDQSLEEQVAEKLAEKSLAEKFYEQYLFPFKKSLVANAAKNSESSNESLNALLSYNLDNFEPNARFDIASSYKDELMMSLIDLFKNYPGNLNEQEVFLKKILEVRSFYITEAETPCVVPEKRNVAIQTKEKNTNVAIQEKEENTNSNIIQPVVDSLKLSEIGDQQSSSDAAIHSKAKIEQSFFAKIAEKFKNSTNWFGKLFFKFFSWLSLKFSF